LTSADRQRAARRWDITHAKSQQWQKDLVREVSRHTPPQYRSPFGFTRYFLKPLGGEAEREVKNFPTQHIAAGIINRAQRRLHAQGAQIILQMHDELVIEHPTDQDWSGRMREAMEAPVPELGNVVFPVSISTSKSWG